MTYRAKYPHYIRPIMRIAFCTTFYPYRGGIAQQGAALFRAFEELGYEVKAFNFQRQYPSLIFPGKTQMVSENDGADPIPSVRILDSVNPFSWWRTAKEINEFQPDLVLMNHWISFLAPAFGTVAKNCKAPVVSVVHNVLPHERRFFDMPFTRYFLKHNTGFMTMSKSVLGDLKKFEPKTPATMRIHPLWDHFGAPLNREEACKKLGLPADKKLLLFFGFIREYKGLDILINTLHQLDDSYHLVVAGETYDGFDQYQELIDAGLKKKVSANIRYIDNDEVPQFFSAADLCVLPYRSATQSGIASIALNFSLPILASDVGGLKEYVGDKGLGLVVPEATEKYLAAAIKDYFENDLRPGFEKNIEAYKVENSWHNFASAIVELAEKSAS